MSELSISINDRGLQKLIASYKPQLSASIQRILNDGSIIVQREMRLQAPQGVSTRGLRESIVYELKDGVAVIHPTVKYAKWVETGRLPGKMPPWKKEWAGGEGLVKWAEAHGMVPFVLARHIALKGTKPKWFVKKTYQKTKPQVIKYANVKIGQLVTELNGK